MSLTIPKKVSGDPTAPSNGRRSPLRPKRYETSRSRRLLGVLRLVVLLAVLAAGAVWAGSYLRSQPGRQWLQRAASLGRQPLPPDFVPTTRVDRGSIEISLTIVGVLKAEESVPVTSETSGIIVSVVEDGAPVKKDDVLVELQNDQLQLQINERRVAAVNAVSKLEQTKRDRALDTENAKTQLAKAQEELGIMKQTNAAAIEKAQAELALSKSQLGKNIRLAEEHLITQPELERNRAEVQAKEFAVAKAEAQLKLQQGQLASNENQKQAEVNRAKFAADLSERRVADEIKNAQKNVEMTKKQVDDLTEQLAKSVIKAPADGVAILEQRWDGGQRSLRPGDMVSPRRKLMELPNLSKMIINLEIEEKDIGIVRRGSPVRITLDPYPGALFHGTVQEIAAVAKPANVEGVGWLQGKNTFTTLIRVKESDAQRLRPGMNATTEILASTTKNTTYVPVDALFERHEKPLVYRKRGDHFTATPVVLGPRNKDYVVIHKGISPGDTVSLVFPPEKLIAR